MKKVLILALIIVSISLVSAQIYLFYDINNTNREYKEKIVEQEMRQDEGIYHYVKTNVTYVDYDDPERLSTYEYRHGYSYRTTPEYLERYKTKYADQVVVVEDEKVEKAEEIVESKPKTIKKYFESLGWTIEVECYDSPPKNKFIYRKCKD